MSARDEDVDEYYNDKNIRTINMDGTTISTIDADFMIKAQGLIPLVFKLTQYELAVYTALLALEKPVKARQIALLSGIPRTKVYGALKGLRIAGMVTLILNDIDLEDLPKIWEYWPDKNRQMFMTAKKRGQKMFAAKTDMLEKKIMAMVNQAVLLEDFIEEVKERETNLQNR